MSDASEFRPAAFVAESNRGRDLGFAESLEELGGRLADRFMQR